MKVRMKKAFSPASLQYFIRAYTAEITCTTRAGMNGLDCPEIFVKPVFVSKNIPKSIVLYRVDIWELPESTKFH